MNKKNIVTLSLIVLVIVLCAALSLSLFACKEETTATNNSTSNTDNTESETATVLVSNGDFTATSGSSVPYTATGWTGKSANDSKQTVAGVIHTGDLYSTENATSAWAGIADPGKAKESDKDSAIYMIYNGEANYYTVSNKFTAAIGAYYKVTADFNSIGNSQGAEGGAFVTINGNAYHKFGPFLPSTEGWQTVTIYIEASVIAEESVEIVLSLGDKTTDAIGVAYFDNVVAEKITKADYDAFTVSNADLEAKVSMTFADGDFVNNTGVSNPTDSEVWSKSIGKGDDNTSAITTYVKSGVVNVDEFDSWKEYVGEKEDEANLNPGTPYDIYKNDHEDLSSDRNILMITSFPAIAHVTSAETSKNAYTAVGYANEYKFAIELGSYYELKVWVKTDLINYEYVTPTEEAEASDINNSGAWLKLTGLSSEAVIKNIDANEWTEYTFVIIGHEFRTKSINLELWLGQGGRNGNELACGTVYFDNIRLYKKGTFTAETKQNVLDAYKNVSLYNPTFTCLVDAASINGANVTENTDISNPNFNVLDEEVLPEGWNLNLADGVKGNVSVNETDDATDADVIVRVINTKNAEALATAEVEKEGKDDEEYAAALKQWWLDKYGIEENPSVPSEALDPVLMINNVIASAYTMTLDTDITIVKNLHYRLALWVKTAGVDESTGATISLVSDGASLSSFTKVNTAKYENETTNGYCEYVFYIQGANLVSLNGDDDDHKLSVKIELGSGNAFAPSTFIKGAIFIANVNIEQVTNDEYKAADTDSDYLKQLSLTSSTSATISNGSFNGYTYDDSKVDTGDSETQGSGYQTDYLEPTNWTKDSDLASTVKSGIVNINSYEFVKSEFGANYDFYNAWDNGVSNGRSVDFGAPNLLAINVPTDIKAQLAYKSSSISLTSDKYYIIKGYVRSVDGIVGEISVSANNNSYPLVQKITTSVNDGWKEYVFAIQTGALTSASVTINIYIGNYSYDSVTEFEEASTPKYHGILFLDSFSCTAVDQAKYNAVVENGGSNISYLVDTFSTTNDSKKVSAPKNWTGSGEKVSSSVANTENTQYAGIFTLADSDETILKLVKDETTGEGEEATTEKVVIEGSTMTKADIFNSNGMEDMTVGDGVLLINNQAASYANYKNTSSLTFAKNSYYKVSVYARTKDIEKGKYASIRVETGSDASKFEIPVNTEYRDIKNEKNEVVNYESIENKWQLFTFYVKTAESASTSNVYIYLTLGTSDEMIQGYAFFDNVSIVKLEDSAEFDAAYALRYVVDVNGVAEVDDNGKYKDAETAEEFLRNNRIIRADDAEKEEDTDTEEETPSDNNNTSSELLWLYITSIVIAALLIVVIVVYLIRRYAPKRPVKVKKTEVDYARKENELVEDKKEDEYKD